MRKLIIFAISIAFSINAIAQNTEREKIVFQAMEEELARCEQLTLDGEPAPFFVQYFVVDQTKYTATSVLGSITEEFTIPKAAQIGVDVRLGSYKESSLLEFAGLHHYARMVSADSDITNIRTTLWDLTDKAYKQSIKNMDMKKNVLSQINSTDEVKALDDIMQLPKVINYQPTKSTDFPIEKWHELINKTSAVFANYPEIFNSKVEVFSIAKQCYTANNEGSKLSFAEQVFYIYGYCQAQDSEGRNYAKNFRVTVTDYNNFPTAQELEVMAKNAADKLMAQLNAQEVEEYYSGPIMYVDGAASEAFKENISTAFSNLNTYKAFAPRGFSFSRLEDRLGKKYLDTKITVKNYTNLKEYNGVKTLINFDMDAYGLRPKIEQVLIENGLLKDVLVDIYPTLKYGESSGNNRLAINKGELFITPAPATLHIQSEGAKRFSTMKKTLMKMAKSEGLEYAYIIYNRDSNSSEVYRIDIKSGEEVLVKEGNYPSPKLKELGRIPVISKEETVNNVSYANGHYMTLIAPKAIILNDMEITISKSSRRPAHIITSPYKR